MREEDAIDAGTSTRTCTRTRADTDGGSELRILMAVAVAPEGREVAAGGGGAAEDSGRLEEQLGGRAASVGDGITPGSGGVAGGAVVSNC